MKSVTASTMSDDMDETIVPVIFNEPFTLSSDDPFALSITKDNI